MLIYGFVKSVSMSTLSKTQVTHKFCKQLLAGWLFHPADTSCRDLGKKKKKVDFHKSGSNFKKTWRYHVHLSKHSNGSIKTMKARGLQTPLRKETHKILWWCWKKKGTNVSTFTVKWFLYRHNPYAIKFPCEDKDVTGGGDWCISQNRQRLSRRTIMWSNIKTQAKMLNLGCKSHYIGVTIAKPTSIQYKNLCAKMKLRVWTWRPTNLTHFYQSCREAKIPPAYYEELMEMFDPG